MRTILNENYRIDVFDDPGYSIYSDHNQQAYDQIYLDHPKSYYDDACKHGVKVFQDDKPIRSALLIAFDGEKGISINTAIFDNDKVLICCANQVFCLTVPDLQLVWHTKADEITCFQIFKLDDGYLVQGKVEITKLDKEGNIQWSQPMGEITMSPYRRVVFHILNDHIQVNSHENKEQLKIDYSGNLT